MNANFEVTRDEYNLILQGLIAYGMNKSDAVKTKVQALIRNLELQDF